MRGIAVSVLVLVTFCAASFAWPVKVQRQRDSDGEIYPSERVRPASQRRGAVIVANGANGPWAVDYREPRGASQQGTWIPVNPYWTKYRIGQAREDESEEDDEDAEDDEGSSEEQDELDAETPSWDYLFPAEETGGYARHEKQQQGQGPVVRIRPTNNGVYTLATGSPGGPSKGRSGYNKKPWEWDSNPRWESEGPPRVRGRGPVIVRAGKQQQQQAWNERGPWWSSGPGPRPTGYQAQAPEVQERPVRRNWWWNRQQEETEGSDEEPQQNWWQWGPQRRIKSWSKPKPQWEWEGPQNQNKWGYY